jgi:hypothetical protein
MPSDRTWFLSNKEREYLDSEAGQEQMALQIANSITI